MGRHRRVGVFVFVVSGVSARAVGGWPNTAGGPGGGVRKWY